MEVSFSFFRGSCVHPSDSIRLYSLAILCNNMKYKSVCRARPIPHPCSPGYKLRAWPEEPSVKYTVQCSHIGPDLARHRLA